MSQLLDEQYLTWLYARIGSVNERSKSKTYWVLFRQLYTQEFVWLVANDDNRVDDGRDLRYEFLDEIGISRDVDPDWMGMGCSVLELLMGLAKRFAFETDRTPRYWFWELLENLDLVRFTDAVNTKTKTQEIVNEIVHDLIFRNYHPSGRGGLFPLETPDKDQRNVEIWYQLCAYILERNY